MANTVLKAMVLFFVSMAGCDALDTGGMEARGKGKKIALYVYFADLVIKKIFILKVVYAVVFWIVIHKAGYFLAWFVSYLKEQKRNHEHHASHYHDHYGPHRKQGQSNRRKIQSYRRQSHGLK